MRFLTKTFLLDAGERAINTFAQTMLALLSAAGLGITGFNTIEWSGVLSVSGGAALISILKSVSAVTSSSTPVVTDQVKTDVAAAVASDLQFVKTTSDPKHRADFNPIG